MTRTFSIASITFALSSLAASAAETAARPEVQLDVYDLVVKKGGWVMWPLFALSVVTLMLVFVYFLTIRRNAVVSDRFMDTAEVLIRKRDYLGLVAECHRKNKSISRVAEKALDFMTKNSGVAFKEVREVAEAEGSRQAGILTQRISYLADIGAIAPMIGLLGTVIGMIKSFYQIYQGNFEGVKQMELAGGISEALITTATGLIIGIIALIFYSIFRGKVQKFIAELEAASTHLMALLSAQYKRGNQSVRETQQLEHLAEEDHYPQQPQRKRKQQRRRTPQPIDDTTSHNDDHDSDDGFEGFTDED